MTYLLNKNQTMNDSTDPTGKIIFALGIGLLIAFILPVLLVEYGGVKLLFVDSVIEVLRGHLSHTGIFQLIYPLIAGILALVLAKRRRSGEKAIALIAIGLLPLLVLFVDQKLQMNFYQMMQNIPGWMFLRSTILISVIVNSLILAGGHAARVDTRNKTAAYAAVIGAVLYLLSLVIPQNGRVPIIETFKLMIHKDYLGRGIAIVSGLTGIICLILMIIACIRCFQLLKPATDKAKTGKSIIRLWFAKFFVYIAPVLFIMIVTAISSEFLNIIALIMLVIKVLFWILGLFLLIPLGIAELILINSTPAPAPVSTPPEM